jgi:head-tail adaptor
MADLDRLITLTLRGEPTRDKHNRAVPGPVTFRGKVWARLESAVSDVDFSTGTIRPSGDRRYRVRWREDLETTPPSRITVTDEYGVSFNVQSVEPVDRKRYVELTLEREK